MKYIQKGQEPDELTQFKAQANDNWQPTYDNFRGQDKSIFHQLLISEQGYICCYCGMRINLESSHIEHLKPRSKYPKNQLDYYNLLASCQRDRQPKEPQHCGVKKGEWYDENLMVSPLNPNCEDYFSYSGIGEIIGKTDAAKITIDKLGLNIDKLRAIREEAIRGVEEVIKELSDSEIKTFASYYQKRNQNQMYEPFCYVILYILTDYHFGTVDDG